MLAQAQPGLLDTIPGARNAVNYLLGKVADFQRVPQRLTAAQTNLVNIKRVAESKNRIGNATEAAFAIQEVMAIQADHQKASVSVANALDQLRTSGLLSGPLDAAAAAIDAGAKVTSILTRTSNVEKTANSLSTRVLSPEEQAATQTSTTSALTKYLLWGGLFYAGLWALRKSGGTRKF